MKKFENITDKQIKTTGVQALHDRPNAYSRYGSGAMTAQQLKEAFDALANLIIKHYNEIATSTQNGSFAEYVKLPSAWGDFTFNDFLGWFSSGDISHKLCSNYPGAGIRPLHDIFTIIVRDIKKSCATVEITEDSNGVFKLAAYGGDDKIIGDKIPIFVGEGNLAQSAKDYIFQKISDNINEYGANTVVPYVTGAVSNAITHAAQLDIATNARVDATQENTVASVEYDAKTGVLKFVPMTGEAKQIDLPLELTVQRGYYDADANDLVIVLTSGDEVRIPVDALIYEVIGMPNASATDAGKIPVVSGENKYSLKEPLGVKYKAEGLSFALREGKYCVHAYSGSDTEVVIPSTYEGVDVTQIYPSAFYQKYNMTEVTFPPTMTYIWDGAFKSCYRLARVIIENNDNVVTLQSTSVFSDSANAEYHVPMHLLDSYKNDTNWSVYADKLMGYETLEGLRMSLDEEVQQRAALQEQVNTINETLNGFINVAEVGA
ncbi:MAG: hypothetical protein E7667_03490 [Ruminococcaceae bacterium]|nr:hypothetical protein [Oscillospiraceae bacterium]